MVEKEAPAMEEMKTNHFTFQIILFKLKTDTTNLTDLISQEGVHNLTLKITFLEDNNCRCQCKTLIRTRKRSRTLVMVKMYSQRESLLFQLIKKVIALKKVKVI